jgi:hypothetical protein
MSIKTVFVQTVMILILLTFCSCTGDSSKDTKKVSKSKKITIEKTESFFGWNSTSLVNLFARIDVVPEIGGRIIGYKANTYQVLWHNPAYEGQIEIFQRNERGKPYIDPGGAKVWPAPQDKWQGPPDNILDCSSYTYTNDGTTITVTSPKDNASNRTGLQFIHAYTLTPFSSLVNLNLSMSNIIDRQIEWALWHLVTIPVDKKFTVYVPAEKNGWDVMLGEDKGTQWLGIENNLFRARYNKINGKIGFKVREGWLAMHNEEKNIVFAMFFPLKKGVQYPHGGHNVEIYSSGEIKDSPKDSTGASSASMEFMELEVLGPVTKLSPGGSDSLNIRWGVCSASGIEKVTQVGVVAERITVSDDKIVTGKFGVFYTGALQEYFIDKNGNKKGRDIIMDVSPLNEIVLKRELSIPKDAYAVQYQILGTDRNIIGIIDEALVPISKEIPQKPKKPKTL